MVNHRLEIQPTVPDFMDKMIAAYKSGKMSYDQLEGNSQLLIAGGSETTSTHLAGELCGPGRLDSNKPQEPALIRLKS